MNKINSAEIKTENKIIPFTLVKYFTLTSFLLMFVGTIALSTFHTHLVRKIILKKSKDYAKVLVENLNHQIFLQFILPVYLDQGKIQLSKETQFKRMDKVVRATLHSFDIKLVNIYDISNVVSYSFNPEIIGEKNLGGEGYNKAVKGEMTSALNQSGSFFQKLIRYPEVARISTFAPLRVERPGSRLATGPILGVMEIVQDVSEDYKRIFRLQLLVILTTTMVMAVLFLILRQIVKNGEEIIMEKNRERLKLREELDRARHLSSIGEMTAIISHEIKNPLGIIRSSAEHLSKKLTEVNQTDTFAKIIIEESGRMNQIINDFLSFAKPGEPALNPCSINDILKKNTEYLKHEFSRKNCSVTTDFDPEIPKTYADENKLYESFLNILINSMQAMPLGGEIFISTAFKDSEIEVKITDTGPGIPEDIIKKVKDPFFTTKTDGSGLGLGIVEQTVKNHNGKFLIGNSSVRGAEVIIRLPIDKGENA
ncbi:MAG: nitrogen regulation protein NR(II) [Desulfobacteraceae bacterium]|jgi:signal transduction histidine kinase